MKVIVLRAFYDVPTGKDYRPGDEIVGWPEERTERYARAGFVKTEKAAEVPRKRATKREKGPSEDK